MTAPGATFLRTPKGPVSRLFALVTLIAVFTSGAFAKFGDVTGCKGAACRDLGMEISGRLFEREHICKDFYSFVCGAWHLTHQVPRGEIRRDQFEEARDSLQATLKGILESREQKSDTPQIKAAKAYHRACTNNDVIEEKGITRTLELLKEGGGFPILNPEAPLRNEKSWHEIARHFGKLRGNPIFYTLGTTVHANRSVLTLDVPKFVLPPKVLLSNTDIFKKNYYREMIRDIILRLVTVPITETLKDQIGAQISSLLDFEIELAKIVTNEDRGVTTYLTTVGEFQKLYKGKLDMMVHGNTEYAGSCLLLLSRRLIPKTSEGIKEHQCQHQVDWLNEIRAILNIEDSEFVHQHTPFVVTNVEYIVKLCRLLERTSERDIVNYIHWNFVRSLLPFIDERMKKILNIGTERSLFIYQEHPERWQQCFLENAFKPSVYNKLLTMKVTEEASEMGLDIVSAIELEVHKEFSKPVNFSGSTMHIAQDAFLAKRLRYIAPNFYTNAERINKIPIEASAPENYLDQVLSHGRYRSRVGLWSTFELLDNDIDMDTLAPKLSADIYDVLTRPSIIDFPVGSMQLPFFDTSLPEAFLFGSIGSQYAQLSSEIVNQHIHRDLYIDFRLRFEKKTVDCFKNQHFGEYKGEKTDLLLRGDFEIEQRYRERQWSNKIQDATGLNVAYNAYKQRVASRGDQNMTLPGLESYNSDQLFFIAFANTHCETPVSGDVRKLAPWYKTRKYSNADMVNMAIMNHENFGTVFQCAEDTPMNPAQKCKYSRDISDERYYPYE